MTCTTFDKWKVGDAVECILSYSQMEEYITIGKIYSILVVFRCAGCISIINDNGVRHVYPNNRFQLKNGNN